MTRIQEEEDTGEHIFRCELIFCFVLQEYIYKDSSRWNFSFNYYVMMTRADMHTKKVVS